MKRRAGLIGRSRSQATCTDSRIFSTHIAYTSFEPGIASVPTPRDYFSPQGPATAACLGCHDNVDAAAHAYLNTAVFGTSSAEACATCHGTGKDWDVDKVHAR
jgi:hypothetical protein